MKADKKWIDLGWRHPLWNIIRLYTPLGQTNAVNEWDYNLKKRGLIEIDNDQKLTLSKNQIDLFYEYIEEREKLFKIAFNNLRTEEEAIDFCQKNGFEVGKTKTRNLQHHQSSKSLVAAVSSIAKIVCLDNKTKFISKPYKRCVWSSKKGIHATVRNLDGAIPSLVNPIIIWEIKEYWGKTRGGSKMSDALYECQLVGFELREYEKVFNRKIYHIVFLDGKIQWDYRKSDLKRFIDLMNQGLIDRLIIGREVETQWRKLIEKILSEKNKFKINA